MENIELYMRIMFELLTIITLIWTIIQHWQIRNRVLSDEIATQDDYIALEDAINRLNGDLKELRARTSTTKAEVFDYVEQNMKPIVNRLAVRASRAKQSDEQTQKKGGIIPLDGLNKQT